ncbi:HET-domain-containing protein, partial [Coniophora puteana RWD-64-598 SS2]
MRLVERGFVKEYYQHEIESLTDDELVQRDSASVEELVASVVRYAILSHRWGPKEPTYADLASKSTDRLRCSSGPGYAKLYSFCLEAQRRGYLFAWSDTCCIDKSSSAELDESVRSMFRWYRNSDICIVHLSQTEQRDDLRCDEWFFRGWTLQELLAPRRIKFFNSRWKALTSDVNDKDTTSSLLLSISEVTEIPRLDIAFFSPLTYAVDTRMTWAAKRVTTRAEDVAYSLMGVFGVSFQIAYGEGADRAFARLIEAIILSGCDLSVLNW